MDGPEPGPESATVVSTVPGAEATGFAMYYAPALQEERTRQLLHSEGHFTETGSRDLIF